jgi:uncharacterized membrane-anchored protein
MGTMTLLRALCVPLLLLGAADGEAASEEEWREVDREIWRNKVDGPFKVAVKDQADLEVPEGTVFIPPQTARRLLRAIGMPTDDSEVGIILPPRKAPWFVVVTLEQNGYVRDDDASDWRPEDLLEILKQSAEDENEARVKEGRPAIEILGWHQAPRYDQATHRLTWSVSTRRKGESQPGDRVRHQTFALGREGYVAFELITDTDKLDEHLPIVNGLSAALKFLPGKRYEDFDSSNDRTARYGLARIVAGAAATKWYQTLADWVLNLGVLALALAAALWLARKIFGKTPKKRRNLPPGAT